MPTTIKGLKSLESKLRALPVAAKAAIASAMEDAANDIVAMMKSLASRFTDTGDLQMSIGWTWGKAPKGALTVATVAGKGNAKDLLLTIYAGNEDAFYARWVEFGTKPHNVALGGGTKRGKRDLAEGSGTGHPGAKAQPFFYVSYRARKKSTKAKISRAINKAAKAVAANGPTLE